MNILGLLLIVTQLVTDAPSTEVYLTGTYGQSTYAIDGDRNGGFSVQANSIFDIDSVHRVFGEASYTWNQSHGNRFVENADYDILSPYLTVDTVGGGMRTETYFFRGGYRMNMHKVVWYTALQFRALQSYRAVDPRPKNKVADLRFEAGVGYTNNTYSWLVAGKIGRYKQNNDIKFYSELGESQIYHLVGPGTAYTRFSGNKKESYYHGLTAGATVAMMPHDQGWLAEVDYQYLRVTKELHDNTFVPIGRIQTHAVEGAFGYVAPSWQAVLLGGIFFRRGAQYIYGEAVNNSYEFLTLQHNFAENGWHIGAEGNYNLELPIGEMTFNAAIDYNESNTASLDTEPRWKELYGMLTEDVVSASASVRYAFPIKGRFSWFFEPAADYCYYTNTTRQSWQVALHTGIVF